MSAATSQSAVADPPFVALDPRALWRSTDAMSALRELATWIRRHDREELDADDPRVAAVAAATQTAPVDNDTEDLLAPLGAIGGVAEIDGARILTFRLINAGGLITFLPLPTSKHDVIYTGPESVELLRVAWCARRGGKRALDLGSGAGFLSAALMSRFDQVVAVDSDARAAAATAITIELNRPPGRRAGVLRGDVGSALSGASFDLILANPPWVPTNERLGGSTFADGGATGSELPRRFALDAARLLAPGGLAIIFTLDTLWADGRRPALQIVTDLQGAGARARLDRVDAPQINDRLADGIARAGGPIREAALAAIRIDNP